MSNKGSDPNGPPAAEPGASGEGRTWWWPIRGQRRSTTLKPEVKQEWHEVQDELKRFQQSFDVGAQNLEEHSVNANTDAAVTRSHWVKSADCQNCSNQKCKRPLWAMSKHHCRKCGLVFCARCVQFKKRLSRNAAYDPNGWLCKVCEKCFNGQKQEIGHSRRWTYDLQLFRAARQSQENAKLDRTVILRVCKNLVEGFQANHSSGGATPQSAGAATPSAAQVVPEGAKGDGPAPRKNPFTFIKGSMSKVVGQGVPDWQKPPTWVSEGTSCQCCDRPYGKLESRSNCRICGKLVCKPQSSRDLLLYTPDKSDQAELGSHPRWAVIKIIGSPEVEPDKCLYLRICNPCKEQLQTIQIEECKRLIEEGGLEYSCLQQLLSVYTEIIKAQEKINASIPEIKECKRLIQEGGLEYSCLQQLLSVYTEIIKAQEKINASIPEIKECKRLIEEGGLEYSCLQQLLSVYTEIIKAQEKIDASIPEFQKLVDGLEIQAGAPASLPPSRNNMQLLAKHQGDLSDHLSEFVVTVGRLKKLQPQSRLQVKLVKNIMSCKFTFYQETNGLYRQLRKQLGEITPTEILQEIQSIVDGKAINSTCLSLNQLAFECLHICTKHKLDETLPLSIKQTAEICESDVKKKMESSGEDWEEHKKKIGAFVKIQIKGDEENGIKPRLYIRPSRRRTKREGVVYVEWFVNQRVSDVLEKVNAQLVSRTADRSFKRTKLSLERLREDLREEKNDEEKRDGWIVL